MFAPFLQNPLLHHTPVLGVYPPHEGEVEAHVCQLTICPQRALLAVTGGAAPGPAGFGAPGDARFTRSREELTRILYGCECLNVRNAEKGAFLPVLPEGFAGTHWKYTPTRYCKAHSAAGFAECTSRFCSWDSLTPGSSVLSSPPSTFSSAAVFPSPLGSQQ